MRERALAYIERNKETGVTFEDLVFNENADVPFPESIPNSFKDSYKLMISELQGNDLIREENGIYFPQENTFSAEKAVELFLDYGDWDEIDDMAVTDILYQFRSLREEEGYIPSNIDVQVSTTHHESGYEHIIVFKGQHPIYNTLVPNIMKEERGFFRGIKKDGIKKLFKAIEKSLSNQPDVLIEVEGGVAYLTESPEHILVEIKDWDNEA